jgi:hypothetical protein
LKTRAWEGLGRDNAWLLARCLPSAEQVSVIQAVAIHTGIAPGQNQSQEKSLYLTAAAVTVNLEALATGASTDSNEWIPIRWHGCESCPWSKGPEILYGPE